MQDPSQSPERHGFTSDTPEGVAAVSDGVILWPSGEVSPGDARLRDLEGVEVADAEVRPGKSLTPRQKHLAEIATRAAVVNARNHDLKMQYLVSAMRRDQIRPAH